MTEFSFEKYMDDTIGTKYSAVGDEATTIQRLILENPNDEISDFPLDQEAQIVTKTLIAGDIEIDKLLRDPHAFDENDPASMVAGWDLSAFTANPQYRPRAINGEIKVYSFLSNSMVLSDEGKVYDYGIDMRPFRHGQWLPEAVRDRVDLSSTLEQIKEHVRYGLAGLVAKHMLEIPE